MRRGLLGAFLDAARLGLDVAARAGAAVEAHRVFLAELAADLLIAAYAPT
ncbi:hypothetical protein [Streptomyces sp. RKND-216]|nr:hypothetical protein [Streptomyces sp. RKND-216]